MKRLFFLFLMTCFIQVFAQKLMLNMGGSRFDSRSVSYDIRPGLYIEPSLKVGYLSPTFSFSAIQPIQETVLTPRMIIYGGPFQQPVDTLYNVRDDYQKLLFSYLLKFKFNVYSFTDLKFNIYCSPMLGAYQFIQKQERVLPYQKSIKTSVTHFSFGADVGIEYLLVEKKDLFLNADITYNAIRYRYWEEPYYHDPTPFSKQYNSTWQLRVGITAKLWNLIGF